tara:strand:+ start:176 stop:442 length:267 start_codon:yes stop_codon:yes gene_type:complete
MLKTDELLIFKKLKLIWYFVEIIIVVGVITILVACSKKTWKDHGDSCIYISENPPLKRVINYADHDLCDRKLSPRIAPNPNTRVKKRK